MIPITPTLTITEVLIIALAAFGILAHIWGWQEALQDEGAVLARGRNTLGAYLLLDTARAHARSEAIRLVIKILFLAYGLNAAGVTQGPASIWAQSTILGVLALLTAETWMDRKMRRTAIRNEARLPERLTESRPDALDD